MKALVRNSNIAISNYGAAELKAYEGKAAFRGFSLTLLIVGFFILLFFFIKQEVILSKGTYTPPVKLIETINIDVKLPDIIQPTQLSSGIVKQETGTKKIAGDYKAVDDNTAGMTDVTDIATIDVMDKSSATQGMANSIDETFPMENSTSNKPAVHLTEKVNTKVEPVDFAEKPPSVDMAKLQKSIVYPPLARKVNVEGRVLVNALVGIDGAVVKANIEISENVLFNEAAIKAVMTPDIFSPAMQDNRLVPCWITIPIIFRLR